MGAIGPLGAGLSGATTGASGSVVGAPSGSSSAAAAASAARGGDSARAGVMAAFGGGADPVWLERLTAEDFPTRMAAVREGVVAVRETRVDLDRAPTAEAQKHLDELGTVLREAMTALGADVAVDETALAGLEKELAEHLDDRSWWSGVRSTVSRWFGGAGDGMETVLKLEVAEKQEEAAAGDFLRAYLGQSLERFGGTGRAMGDRLELWDQRLGHRLQNAQDVLQRSDTAAFGPALSEVGVFLKQLGADHKADAALLQVFDSAIKRFTPFADTPEERTSVDGAWADYRDLRKESFGEGRLHSQGVSELQGLVRQELSALRPDYKEHLRLAVAMTPLAKAGARAADAGGALAVLVTTYVDALREAPRLKTAVVHNRQEVGRLEQQRAGLEAQKSPLTKSHNDVSQQLLSAQAQLAHLRQAGAPLVDQQSVEASIMALSREQGRLEGLMSGLDGQIGLVAGQANMARGVLADVQQRLYANEVDLAQGRDGIGERVRAVNSRVALLNQAFHGAGDLSGEGVTAVGTPVLDQRFLDVFYRGGHGGSEADLTWLSEQAVGVKANLQARQTHVQGRLRGHRHFTDGLEKHRLQQLLA